MSSPSSISATLSVTCAFQLVLKEEQDRKQMVEDLVNQVHSYVEERGSLSGEQMLCDFLGTFLLCGVFSFVISLLKQGISSQCAFKGFKVTSNIGVL